MIVFLNIFWHKQVFCDEDSTEHLVSGNNILPICDCDTI